MTRFFIIALVPAQAVGDLKAAVHGLDSLIGRRGHSCPLPGPLRFKGGTIGQPARGGLPPRHFRVVGFGRGCVEASQASI